MSKVTADKSMSLDGFITGPNDSVELPLGQDGERLHQWVDGLETWRERHGLSGGKTDSDAEILDEAWRNTRAVVMDKRMFDHGEGPWGDNPPFHMPVFVVTHHLWETVVKEGGTTFTFATDGVESTLQQAKAAAGDKDVLVAGGANIIQQLLRAGLLDELQIHLVPVLLGDGRRLFAHVVTEYVSLDGVMEEPAWTGPYWNDDIAKFKYDELFSSDALLLGRVTYQGFAKAWLSMTDEQGFADRMNNLPKYVASRTLEATEWNAHLITGDIAEEVARLKQQPGQDLLIYGSGELVHTLMHHDLIDEYRLLVYPVVLGSGKRLFRDGSNTTLKLVQTQTFSSGVVALTYQPAQRA